jgi:response regulator RpfG family c-di-GMP phosphodiesterase
MNAYIPNTKVLYVDDEASLLSSFSSLFWREPLQIFTLADSTAIDTLLELEGPFAVVISDQRMPKLDGVGTLNRIKQRFPETVRILMTGYANLDDTQRAINEAGISRYVSKPWDDDALKAVVHEGVTQYNLAAENAYLNTQLTDQNKILSELLEGTVGQSMHLLSHLISYINPHAANQAERVRKLGRAILSIIPNLSEDERWEISRALDLFNLGIAVLPPWIQVTLNKEGLKSLERFPASRCHHVLASDLIKEIPRFERVASIIRYQAKDFNGAGEPVTEIVRGKNLPLGSRLLHILIDLDLLSTDNFKGKDILQQMMSRTSKYDFELIAMMLGHTAEQKQGYEEKSVPVAELQEGMLLVDDIVTEHRQTLLKANTMLSSESIKVIHQWNNYDRIHEPILVRISHR